MIYSCRAAAFGDVALAGAAAFAALGALAFAGAAAFALAAATFEDSLWLPVAGAAFSALALATTRTRSISSCIAYVSVEASLVSQNTCHM